MSNPNWRESTKMGNGAKLAARSNNHLSYTTTWPLDSPHDGNAYFFEQVLISIAMIGTHSFKSYKETRNYFKNSRILPKTSAFFSTCTPWFAPGKTTSRLLGMAPAMKRDWSGLCALVESFQALEVSYLVCISNPFLLRLQEFPPWFLAASLGSQSTFPFPNINHLFSISTFWCSWYARHLAHYVFLSDILSQDNSEALRLACRTRYTEVLERTWRVWTPHHSWSFQIPLQPAYLSMHKGLVPTFLLKSWLRVLHLRSCQKYDKWRLLKVLRWYDGAVPLKMRCETLEGYSIAYCCAR